MRETVRSIILGICLFVGLHACAMPALLNDYMPKNKEELKEITPEGVPVKMIGWVNKKQFVDGSPIEVWDLSESNTPKKILEGIVSREDDKTYVDGVFFGRYTDEICQTRNPEPQERHTFLGLGGRWHRNVSDVIDAQGQKRVSGRFSIWNTDDEKLKADNKSQKKNGKVVQLSIKIVSVDQYEFVACREAFRYGMSIKKQNNGSLIAYIDPVAMSDFWGKKAISVEKPVNTFSDPEDKDWHVVFENGDEWIGELFHTQPDSRYSGEYKFSNGDAVHGWFRSGIAFGNARWSDFIFNTDDASIDFADGERVGVGVLNGDAKKHLSRAQIRDIASKSITLTEYRDNIRNAIETAAQEKAEMKERKKYETEKKLEDLRKYAVAHYGRFGEDVSNGKLKIGMTRKMVETAIKVLFSSSARGWNVLASESHDGFDPDPDLYTFDNVYSPIVQTTTMQKYKMNRMGQFMVGDSYSIITFRNGKLSEIVKGR